MKKRLAAACLTLAVLPAVAALALRAGKTAVQGTPNACEMETWNLSGLVPAGLSMTDEAQCAVRDYFDALDETAREYIVLLLQQIANRDPTAADSYCDRESGVYLRACQYCLYDMDLDGAPEFILKTGGSEADFRYTFYTVADGELVECGRLSGSHAELYANGSGSFVRYAGQMGTYDITAAALEGAALVTQAVACGTLDPGKGGEYPALAEFGYGDYSRRLEFTPIPTLFLAPQG